jgi:hypothetical protein
MDELERRKSILMLAVLYKRMGEDGECGDDLKVGGAYSFRRRGRMTATSIVMQKDMYMVTKPYYRPWNTIVFQSHGTDESRQVIR